MRLILAVFSFYQLVLRAESKTVVALIINFGDRKMTKYEAQIELGVFLDHAFLEQFNESRPLAGDNVSVEAYVAQVFHAVEIVLRSPSLTPSLRLAITHLQELPPDPSPDSHKRGYATEYLSQFCEYQASRANQTWDHAILLTGWDLHRGQGGKDILKGRAQFGRMCSRRWSCSVAEAAELDSPFLIAHEFGHSLAMKHDEDDQCSSGYLMAAGLGAGKTSWSSCSQRSLAAFLATPEAACLDETSFAEVLPLPRDVLPGQTFDEDAQCRLAFHDPAIRSRTLPQISHREGICHMLWCATGPYARHFGAHPALPGTFCAPGRWCQEGRCEPFPEDGGPQVLHGAWSQWAEDSPGCHCAPMPSSLPMRRWRRSCTEPSPLNGGEGCSGVSAKYTLCGGPCPALAEGEATDPVAFGDAVCRAWRDERNKTVLTGKGKTHWLQLCTVGCEIAASRTSFVGYGDVFPDGMKCGTERDEHKFCFQGDCLDPQECTASNRRKGFCNAPDHIAFEFPNAEPDPL